MTYDFLTENRKLKLQKKKLGATAAGFIIFPSINLLGAFWLMLGLGAAHDQWPAIPALGFWTTYLIGTGISVLSGFIHHGNRIAFKKEEI